MVQDYKKIKNNITKIIKQRKINLIQDQIILIYHLKDIKFLNKQTKIYKILFIRILLL